MRLAAYLRVSTVEQVDHGQGLDIQESAINKWARSNGHRIAHWFQDEGVSGTIEHREGLESALASITGQTRIIPVYRSVSGSGDNAVYEIVKFVGVRIMSVNLSGGDKAVYVQPALVTVRGAIASNQPGTSEYVYSPVVLVR